MSLHHCWDWQSPQTASCIHLKHIQGVWAHWYGDHGHMAIAANIYTPTSWVRCWGSGSLVESKWCHYIMVEADSHLKLSSCIHIRHTKSFEHLDMLSMGIWQEPDTVKPTLLGSDVGVLGHLQSQNDVNTSWLRPTATSDCFPHPSLVYLQGVWAHWYADLGHTLSALHYCTHTTWVRFWGSGSLVESKWLHDVIVEGESNLKFLTSILDIYKVFELIDMLSMGMRQQPETVIPTLLGSDFGVLGCQNDAITPLLTPTATYNWLPAFILDMYKVF